MGLRTVSFKIEEGVLRRLDSYASARGMTRSEVIRRAIVRLLAEEEPVRERGSRGLTVKTLRVL